MPLPRNPSRISRLWNMGFWEDPFSPAPDPHFFWFTSQHGPLFEKHLQIVDRGLGIAITDGDPGLGKSALARRLEAYCRARQPDFDVAFLCGDGPFLQSEYTLLWDIATSLGLPRRKGIAAQIQEIEKHALVSSQDGRRVVLIVDAAEDVSDAVLERLYGLSVRVCPVFLFGPKIMSVTAGRNPDVVFNASRASLSPLAFGDLSDLLLARCAAAGNTVRLFAPDVLERIWTVSAGVPRDAVTLSSRILDIVSDADTFPITLEKLPQNLWADGSL